ncbi:hypothetical protein EVAR_38935_1 [Eumeta japonica]|uniref:Uncharacterized protein n=1 Tax=Eumeta variegata TaxID=151549 RepID=A0A4C1ZSP3_EUMVA|nr:hypothetical protein EVAR_38935_1 [Eumeta japonica]
MMVTRLACIALSRIFEETDQVRLASLLEGHHGGALEPQVGLEVLRYLADRSLKWRLRSTAPCSSDSDGSREDDSSRPVAVGFFTPPVAGALLRAAFVASCLRGALPPVDLRAVCFVRATTDYLHNTLYAAHTQISHESAVTTHCAAE